MVTKISYTVRASQRETVLYSDGDVAQAKGTTIYLGYSNEGGGWPQWGKDIPSSTPYKSAAHALKTAKEMDGMPWWNKPDMTTLQAIEISETTTRTEKEIT